MIALIKYIWMNEWMNEWMNGSMKSFNDTH